MVQVFCLNMDIFRIVFEYFLHQSAMPESALSLGLDQIFGDPLNLVQVVHDLRQLRLPEMLV